MGYNVNEDLVKGNDIFLYITSGGTGTTKQQVLAFATSCQMQVDGETISTQNKMSCRWASNLAGNNSYTISADALYTQTTGVSFDDLMAMMIKGDPVDWAMGPAIDESALTCENKTFVLDDTKVYYSGKALITSLSLNAGNNEVASSSVTLTGSGEIDQHK